MSKTDSQELNDILRRSADNRQVYEGAVPKVTHGMMNDESPPIEPFNDMKNMSGFVQWTTSDGKRFIPSSHTAEKLTPGVYEIMHSNTIGVYFEQIPVLTTGLLRFPETESDKVVEEIQKFWNREQIFRKYSLTYKRGIILWGPPGSGKSCTIQLIMRDVVERGGVVIKFTHPTLFTEGIRKFREIEPNTPVVILMEDIDSILENYVESEVLNILDGINMIEKAVFLATTNYPEKLGPRIINRPSRFDKRFKIGHPLEDSRRLYFEYIMGGEESVKSLKIDLDKWVEDTEDFSIAHLKELFTAVIILGDDYDEAIEALSLMREKSPDSIEDEVKRPIGFGKCGPKKRRYHD